MSDIDPGKKCERCGRQTERLIRGKVEVVDRFEVKEYKKGVCPACEKKIDKNNEGYSN